MDQSFHYLSMAMHATVQKNEWRNVYLRENETDTGTEFFRAKFWFYRKRKMREIWKNFIIKKWENCNRQLITIC